MNFWLFLHLAGAVLFAGNIITAAFWKIRAESEKNPVLIHSAAKNVMLADYVFTLPGLVLIISSGIVMTVRAGIPLDRLNWLTLSLILLAVTGIVWGGLLVPLQRAMIRYSAASVESGKVTSAYLRASRRWNLLGTVATLLPLIIFYLMVMKSF